jgi:PKD repeat protein
MKKITKLLSIILLGISLVSKVNAQDEHLNCGSSQANNEIFEANPLVKAAYLQREAEYQRIDQEAFAKGYQESNNRAANPVYIIPIVFHILHQDGPENISDAQVKDEVRILNEDYRKLNSDIANVVTSFKALTADCEIEFRLAQKTPTGAWTNGIDRIFTPLTNNADNGSKLNDWPCNKYLNVWVVKSIGKDGVAGYSYYPGVTSNASDGVIILNDYIGSIGTGQRSHSRALTHEIGHWLNLSHTWGSTNDPEISCGDDNVSDTPLTKGHKSCKLTDAVCTSGVVENVQNYMEYSYCSNMFTTGQKNRMRTALTSATGGRNNLWTAANLTATGVSLPATIAYADFTSSKDDNSVCQGSTLTFTDLSWNGVPTSYSWTFAGGTPATSTAASPTITYNTPGVYSVSLTVSNSTGSASATKTSYITVYRNTAAIQTDLYQETFEGSAIPNTNWQVNNGNTGTNTWVQTNAAASSGTKCVRIVNNTDGYTDDLISPSIDMTKITAALPYLTYKVAFAQKSASNNDKLQVFVSTNCAQTWTLRGSLMGSALSTTGGALITNSFVPTASQWIMKSVNLGSYKSYSNLYIMFRFISNGGNNIYIDDINIDALKGVDDILASTINFNVYPNPAEENTMVSFELLDNQKTDVALYDVFGRKVSSIFSGNLSAGEHQLPISKNEELAAGIYFVKLSIGESTFTKKLIVN